MLLNTRYRGATNHNPSRILVTDNYGEHRLTFGWDYALNVSENHRAAAEAYRARFCPEYKVAYVGENFDGSGQIFACDSPYYGESD